MIFGSVYIGVFWHQVKNYYNFQYGITTGYIEFDYRTHAWTIPKIMLQVNSSELKKVSVFEYCTRIQTVSS